MKNITPGLIISVLVSLSLFSAAQRPLENLMSGYYANKMLWNAAFTAEDGNKIHALQNRSWIGFDAAPVLTSISGQYAFNNNTSAGLVLMNDKAGILIRSYGMLNYAYTARFNESDYLKVGAAFTFRRDRLDNSGAAANDPVVHNTITRKSSFDGNMGAIYKMKTLTIGLAINNIGENLNKKQEADLSVAQVGAYYGFNINKNEDWYMEPMAMMRFSRVTSAVADAGFLVRYNKLINLMGVYQTTGNIRSGIGLALNKLGEINIYYNTNHKISQGNSRQFEVGATVFFKNKAEK